MREFSISKLMSHSVLLEYLLPLGLFETGAGCPLGHLAFGSIGLRPLCILIFLGEELVVEKQELRGVAGGKVPEGAGGQGLRGGGVVLVHAY